MMRRSLLCLQGCSASPALLALVALEVLLRHTLSSVPNSPALTEFWEKGKLVSQSYNTSSLSGYPSFFQSSVSALTIFWKGPRWLSALLVSQSRSQASWPSPDTGEARKLGVGDEAWQVFGEVGQCHMVQVYERKLLSNSGVRFQRNKCLLVTKSFSMECKHNWLVPVLGLAHKTSVMVPVALPVGGQRWGGPRE